MRRSVLPGSTLKCAYVMCTEHCREGGNSYEGDDPIHTAVNLNGVSTGGYYIDMRMKEHSTKKNSPRCTAAPLVAPRRGHQKHPRNTFLPSFVEPRIHLLS